MLGIESMMLDDTVPECIECMSSEQLVECRSAVALFRRTPLNMHTGAQAHPRTHAGTDTHTHTRSLTRTPKPTPTPSHGHPPQPPLSLPAATQL